MFQGWCQISRIAGGLGTASIHRLLDHLGPSTMTNSRCHVREICFRDLDQDQAVQIEQPSDTTGWSLFGTSNIEKERWNIYIQCIYIYGT